MSDAAAPIETVRLRLRKPCLADFEDLCTLWADPVVTRFITGQPFPRRQTWQTLLSLVGHWELYGYGGWILEDKATAQSVGQIGFQRFVRGLDASREALPEAGWVLASSVHGRGFGSEAVAALLAWGDEHLEAAHTVAIVDPANTASLRIAAKFGYREVARPQYLQGPVVLLERPRQRRAERANDA